MEKIYSDEEMDIITLHNMKRIVSRQYGEINIFKDSIKCYRYNEDGEKVYFGNTPQYFRYNAVVGKKVDISTIYDKEPRLDKQDEILAAGASTLNKGKAMIGAIGEAFERMSLYNNKNIKSYYSSYNELKSDGFNIIHPQDLIFFSDAQYKDPNFLLKKYDCNDKIHWCEVRRLNSEELYLAPTRKITFNYLEDKLDYAITTGLACGSFEEQAILNGIYEVIERDNFMLMWNLKLGCKEIILDKIKNKELKESINKVKRFITGEDKLKLFNISLFENIYTMMAVIKNDVGDSPGVMLSASTNLDPEKAILGCINEMHLTYNYTQTYMKNDFDKSYLNISKYDINSLENHIKYYFSNRNNKNIDFFFDNSPKEYISLLTSNSTGNYINDINTCISILKEKGYDVFYIDCTPEKIKQVGFWVARIIIPHLMNLEVSHNARHTSGKRMDYYREKYNIKDINDEPHPFP